MWYQLGINKQQIVLLKTDKLSYLSTSMTFYQFDFYW